MRPLPSRGKLNAFNLGSVRVPSAMSSSLRCRRHPSDALVVDVVNSGPFTSAGPRRDHATIAASRIKSTRTRTQNSACRAVQVGLSVRLTRQMMCNTQTMTRRAASSKATSSSNEKQGLREGLNSTTAIGHEHHDHTHEHEHDHSHGVFGFGEHHEHHRPDAEKFMETLKGGGE